MAWLNKMSESVSGFFELLESLYQAGATDNLWRVNEKFLRIKPYAALNFPARDVHQITNDDNEINIECQFMGLYGVDSPLPAYFNELCLKQDETGQKLRDFLDIFHHRNYALYFLAWRAFQPECAIDEQGNYLAFINSYAGYQTSTDGFSWLEFLARNQDAGLKTAILQIIPDINVNIKSNQLIWQQVDGVLPLGQGLRLGDNTVLGQKMLTESHCVLVELGPLAFDVAQKLLPGTEKALALHTLLRSSLPVTMQYQIKVIFLENSAAPTLGQPDSFLGCQTVMGQREGRQHTFILHETAPEMQRPEAVYCS